ncbi:MAG TPA: (deoxy)nucleoside triphosphate pyrophosphohydrolase [Bacilli bacterium]|jgi:8-oxo-dGTP diphosphatase|nr:(deoxy)nucleoside triphosphate pyrophosphohydrolase [Bacillota bacterium]NLI52657.1 (deoxy)nucleoside triphosphate pyrophosphohydrolase [Erysipelotrichaceae bacterium]OQC50008.1 MAG: CTP pyrophosphohydrolase [Tenericutes bacterium ADurb.Bin024]HOE54355.1 (deoxy)nucleoside triphosphate pyrophosphohydrolase [Bacilli bacterium]TAH59328.1 MAG: (deoxy)nucleoside triphosphate pyrophosphohydrolase [Bacillota bacterium]
MEQKEIKNVVAALIFYDGKLFAASRSEKDERYGKYEFPGGKIELEENPSSAIVREIKEELMMDISVKDLFMHVSHEYPWFKLEMDVFICEVTNPQFTLLVHKDGGFFTKEEILKLPFLGADLQVLAEISKRLDF